MASERTWWPPDPTGHQRFCVDPDSHNPVTSWCMADESEPGTLNGLPSKAWKTDHPHDPEAT